MIQKCEAQVLTNENIKKMKNLAPVLSFIDKKIRTACSEGIKTIEIAQKELPEGKYKFNAVETAVQNAGYSNAMIVNDWTNELDPKTGKRERKDNFVLKIIW